MSARRQTGRRWLEARRRARLVRPPCRFVHPILRNPERRSSLKRNPVTGRSDRGDAAFAVRRGRPGMGQGVRRPEGDAGSHEKRFSRDRRGRGIHPSRVASENGASSAGRTSPRCRSDVLGSAYGERSSVERGAEEGSLRDARRPVAGQGGRERPQGGGTQDGGTQDGRDGRDLSRTFDGIAPVRRDTDAAADIDRRARSFGIDEGRPLARDGLFA